MEKLKKMYMETLERKTIEFEPLIKKYAIKAEMTAAEHKKFIVLDSEIRTIKTLLEVIRSLEND